MALRTPALAILLLACILSAQAERSKPSERSRKQREQGGKDVSWFKVDEDDTEACKDVVETDQTIVKGPPADECKTHNETFCFCGKKGSKKTSSWKYLCGECRQNKPFSFKIEKPGRGGGGGRGGGRGRPGRATCSDKKRPACKDGSSPQKPTEEGKPPVCTDGTSPVCTDGTAPVRPSPCQDDTEPLCRMSGAEPSAPVCGDGSALKEFGPPCIRAQGKPKCTDTTVEPTCEDGSKPKGPPGGDGHGHGHGQGGHGQGGGRGGGRGN